MAAIGLLGAGASLATPPVESIAGLSLPGVPVAITDGSDRSKPVRRSELPHPPLPERPDDIYDDTRLNLTVEPGVTELIPIARNYLNRIITPFSSPKVVTVNPIEFRKEGASIFITTTSEKPVGIHILSNDPQDSRSISLALVPKGIPPKTIRLRWPNAVDTYSPAQKAHARRWEESTPYIDTLIKLMATVARGKIPSGYSLAEAERVLTCDLAGVAIVAGQRLIGGHFGVVVARVTNTSEATLEIQEPRCEQHGVVAVAAWPRAVLAPGESTELYLVVNQDRFEGVEPAEMRPSLLGSLR